MDATRSRRTRDRARERWYAHWRTLRFARRLGFSPATVVTTGTVSRSAKGLLQGVLEVIQTDRHVPPVLRLGSNPDQHLVAADFYVEQPLRPVGRGPAFDRDTARASVYDRGQEAVRLDHDPLPFHVANVIRYGQHDALAALLDM
jgi:hypothetical protein